MILIIRLYPPDVNPVSEDAPGWLAASEDKQGCPRSRNAPTPELAVTALICHLRDLEVFA